MLFPLPIRLALLAAALAGCGCALAQAPPTQPADPALQPAHPATVAYSAGRITVSANNASLNQILRDIALQTGMKITGGVSDERVFGEYGPAAAATVLSQLLDGTGSNMLLVQNSGATPTELILTPRIGGPSPPDPNAAMREREQNSVPVGPPNRPNYRPNPITPRPRPGPPEQNAPNASSTAQPGPTTQQSPNGVRTPQEIYNELQRMRQQNGQQNHQ